MATKAERFALFKDQTKKCLDQMEAQRIKDALGAFLKSKDLAALTSTLKATLDTPDKHCLFSTIRSLIPDKYHDDFDGMTGAEADPVSESAEDDLTAADEAMAREMHLAMTGERVPAPEDEAADDDENDDGPGGESLFDLMIAMAEADLKLDKTSEVEDYVPERKLSENDMKRSHFRQSMKMAQKGFKSASFVRRPSTDQDAGPRRSSVSTHSLALPDYLSTAGSRPAAEAQLKMAGLEPGTFLVREKDMRAGGSFKMRPGQRMPKKAWALSFVTPNGEISHVLIEQIEVGEDLKMGATTLENCKTVDQALEKLRRSGMYDLKGTPFQCRRWYHGQIARQDAEAQLLRSPIDGRFLVRESTREKDTWVISLCLEGKLFHNKVLYKDGSWTANANPSKMHKSMARLVEYHMEEAHGLQHRLSSPVERSEPYVVE